MKKAQKRIERGEDKATGGVRSGKGWTRGGEVETNLEVKEVISVQIFVRV